MPVVTRGLGGYALVTRGLGPLVLVYVTSKGYVLETDSPVGDVEVAETVSVGLVGATTSTGTGRSLDELYADLETILDGHHVFASVSTPFGLVVRVDALGLARIYDQLKATGETVTVVKPGGVVSVASAGDTSVSDMVEATLQDGDI